MKYTIEELKTKLNNENLKNLFSSQTYEEYKKNKKLLSQQEKKFLKNKLSAYNDKFLSDLLGINDTFEFVCELKKTTIVAGVSHLTDQTSSKLGK